MLEGGTGPLFPLEDMAAQGRPLPGAVLAWGRSQVWSVLRHSSYPLQAVWLGVYCAGGDVVSPHVLRVSWWYVAFE